MRNKVLSALAAAALSASAFAAGYARNDPFAEFSSRLGGAGTRDIIGEKAFTFPAANAEKPHMWPFFFGNRLFNTNWVQSPGSVKAFDGLGPVFNRTSCAGCHTRDGRGRPPEPGQPMRSMLLRISVPDGDGIHRPHPAYGDQLGEQANPGVPAEGKTRIDHREIAGSYGDGEAWTLLEPAYSIESPAHGPVGETAAFSARVAPQIIGLGLLEAVPEADILSRADPDDRDGDGVSGRANRIGSTAGSALGRFGWKANMPDLATQNAGAAFGDIGLTNPLHREENCPDAQVACLAAIRGEDIDLSAEFLDKLTHYTRLLAVPAQRNAGDSQVLRGQGLFAMFGCASCHVPTLKTVAAPLPELSNQVFHPFTDLLLHDMGEGLADGRQDHLADGREWRTPPLWGIGLIPRSIATTGSCMMAGRGFAEAILWHGGEGESAREAFRTAAKADRESLIAFLQSL
ncbi:MAG: thiol oxidoreductase [Phyllobacteriaceae bacterium]|nr:thiol oxidoreductase [Phyllobacteriaceae bacterium]